MQNKDSKTSFFEIRYESLYRNYYQALLKTADQILGDAYLAEDALQQTFLRLYQYPERLLQLRYGEEWLYL